MLNESVDPNMIWNTVIEGAGTYTLTVSDGDPFGDARIHHYALRTSLTSEPNVTYESAGNNGSPSATPVMLGKPVVAALTTSGVNREIDYSRFQQLTPIRSISALLIRTASAMAEIP